MKKVSSVFALFLLFVGLSACSSNTIQSNYAESTGDNYVVIEMSSQVHYDYILFTVSVTGVWCNAERGYINFDIFTAHYRVDSDGGNLTPQRELTNSGDNFRLYAVPELPCLTGFSVGYTIEVYDKNSNLFVTETLPRYPFIEHLNCNSIISIRIGAGTGVWWCQFFDIYNGIVSEKIPQVITAQYRRLVKLVWDDSRHIAVVRDIFDETYFYQEIELDFYINSASFIPITDVVFLDENTLKIVYMGEGFEEQTTIFSLHG